MAGDGARKGRPGAVVWPEGTAELLARCTFPGPGTPVTCAVSGGKDSLALLALAAASGCRAHAVHVDHGLRAGSSHEAKLVEEAASRLGATFEPRRVDVAPGPDLEARARLARYAVLPDGVLIGHTADDQAETVLLNLIRGAGLDGLAGMRADEAGLSGARRPILALRRSETATLVAALELNAVADRTNADLRFRRNRVRHELLPLMAGVAGRDPVPLLARTASLLSEDARLLSVLASSLDPTDTRALLAAPKPLAVRALRAWLRESDGPERHPPSSKEIERVWEVVTGLTKACELSGGRRLARSSGRLRVETARF